MIIEKDTFESYFEARLQNKGNYIGTLALYCSVTKLHAKYIYGG